jgi:hypothetical protein
LPYYKVMNLAAARGVAVRAFPTPTGPDGLHAARRPVPNDLGYLTKDD